MSDVAILRPPPTREERRPRGGWTPSRWAAIFALPALVILAAHFAPTGGAPYDAFTIGVAAGAALWIATFVPRGIADRVAAFALFRRARLAPGEPWRWDHRWDPRGFAVTPGRRLLRALTQRSVLGAFFQSGLFAIGASGGWRTFLGAVALGVAVLAWRVSGGGTTRVHFAKFPFHPGERATLFFGVDDGGATFESATFFLRRVRESPGGIARPHEVFRTFEAAPLGPRDTLPAPGVEIELSFDLPDDVGPTRLSSEFPRYWVLDVVGETSSGPYEESFLVPVYERTAE